MVTLLLVQMLQRTPLTPGIARFKKVAKKVIVHKRKDIAEKMIAKAELKAKQTKASSRYISKQNSLATKKASSFGIGRVSFRRNL